MRHDILERRIEIEGWIAEQRPKAFIYRELDCKASTLESYLAKMNLSYAGNRGGKGKTAPTRKNAKEFLFIGSLIRSHKLRLKLLEDRLKDESCESCGNKIWLGNPIPLELHHRNGNRFDNRLENLQLLCPNCHSLTENHSGRGKRKRIQNGDEQRIAKLDAV